MKLLFKNFLLTLFAAVCVSFAFATLGIIRLFSRDSIEDKAGFYITLAVNIDYVGGTLLYKTDARTVSAVTGKLSAEESRYIWFETFIDWLFNDPTHCYDAYKKEFK